MRYFNPIQAARILSISDKTVRRHIQKGTIEASRKASGEIKIAEDQVEKLRVYLELDDDTQVSPEIDMSRLEKIEYRYEQLAIGFTELVHLRWRVEELEEKVAELEQTLSNAEEAKASHPVAQLDAVQPVSTKPMNDSSQIAKPQNRNVDATRDIPEDWILCSDFFKQHGIAETSWRRWMNDSLAGDRIVYEKRGKYSYFTPEQAEHALELLRKHGKVSRSPA